MNITQANRTVVPIRDTSTPSWPRWAPYAGVVWSLLYGALGLYWAVSGSGFPYGESALGFVSPLVARFGPGAAWVVVVLAGIPAAALGAAMILGVQRRMSPQQGVGGGALRNLFIAAGALLAGVLLLFMADLMLLESLGYIPFTLFRLLTGADTSYYLKMLAASGAAHQLFCLLGGFLWLAATVSYARRSSDACPACGRTDDPQGWESPERAAHWGRIAVYVAMVAPLFYGLVRYAWALGIPLGMTQEYWQAGQEKGLWVSGLFLATFGLVGALLMLGLVQRWGEVFPRWMIGLSGRRVPIALAVVPAALVSVVLVVGGLSIWSGIGQMNVNMAAAGMNAAEVRGAIVFQLGPTLLFPVWGIALALATLGYYFRRRGPCKVCGRGGASQPAQQ